MKNLIILVILNLFMGCVVYHEINEDELYKEKIKKLVEKSLKTKDVSLQLKYLHDIASQLETHEKNISKINPFFILILYCKLAYLEKIAGDQEEALIYFYKAKYWLLRYNKINFISSVRSKYEYDNFTFSKCLNVGRIMIKLPEILKRTEE